MTVYNAWHLLSKFNKMYVVSSRDNIPKRIESNNIGYYGKKTVTFMCVKDGALHCYY